MREKTAVWVALIRGHSGKIVGRVAEGEAAGKILFFPDQTAAGLVEGQFALAAKTHDHGRYWRGDIYPLQVVHRSNGSVRRVAIPGTEPIYLVDTLDEAKESHAKQLAELQESAAA